MDPILRDVSARLVRCLMVVSLVGASAAVSAEEPTPAPGGVNGGPSRKSGFSDLPSVGGPDGVAAELEEQDKVPEYRFTILHDWLQPWYGWKKRLNERHGLSLGFNATVLGQYSGDSQGHNDSAGGGIYRFQGTWVAVNRGATNPGSLSFRLEYRSKIGPIGPSSFSSELGVGPMNIGFAYSDRFDLDLSVLNWTQIFAGGRAGFVVGRLDFAALLDPYPFQSFAKGYINRGFVYNPTAGTTGVGALGLGIKGFVSEQLWLGAVIYDGNAASGNFDLDSFDAGELLQQAEIGWTPAFARRKTDKVQLTYWSKDERPHVGASEGHGWLLTGVTSLTSRTRIFLRAGISNGGAGVPAENAISAGIVLKTTYDEISFGIGRAEPSEETYGPGLDNELVLEASINLRLSPNFTLMPDVQLVKNPARSAASGTVLVAGLRGRWDL